MALQTPVVTVPQTDTFDQWRVKTKSIITQSNQTVQDVGDIAALGGGQTNLVQAINDNTDFSIAITIALG